MQESLAPKSSQGLRPAGVLKRDEEQTTPGGLEGQKKGRPVEKLYVEKDFVGEEWGREIPQSGPKSRYHK